MISVEFKQFHVMSRRLSAGLITHISVPLKEDYVYAHYRMLKLSLELDCHAYHRMLNRLDINDLNRLRLDI